jgi:hypothetical protein
MRVAFPFDHQGAWCPAAVSSSNWNREAAGVNAMAGDTFSSAVDADGASVVVTRTDATTPWGLNLVFTCCGGSTASPTGAPTATPTFLPTAAPTFNPTAMPTLFPTQHPCITGFHDCDITSTYCSVDLTNGEPIIGVGQSRHVCACRYNRGWINRINATMCNTAAPTAVPTASPTAVPTLNPTATPTTQPTAAPTATPTATPTTQPTAAPTATPTAQPTSAPTATPTATPTAQPTSAPTATPTATPTAFPTVAPTALPSAAAAAASGGSSTSGGGSLLIIAVVVGVVIIVLAIVAGVTVTKGKGKKAATATTPAAFDNPMYDTADAKATQNPMYDTEDVDYIAEVILTRLALPDSSVWNRGSVVRGEWVSSLCVRAPIIGQVLILFCNLHLRLQSGGTGDVGYMDIQMAEEVCPVPV